MGWGSQAALGNLYKSFKRFLIIIATKYFLLAKDAFIGLQDKRGITKCLSALAYVYNVTRNDEKEAETNKELHQLTTGTHNYFAQASAAFNLCRYEIDNHHFDQAQKYFEEADYLNYNYDLDIDDKLDELEDELFSKPTRESLQRIQLIKRELIVFRRTIFAERDKVNDLLRTNTTFISDACKIYLRDTYDHTIQVMDLIS